MAAVGAVDTEEVLEPGPGLFVQRDRERAFFDRRRGGFRGEELGHIGDVSLGVVDQAVAERLVCETVDVGCR